jgi:hypothetical protein
LDYLRSATREYVGKNAIAEFQFVDEFPQSPSGKLQFCRSEIQPDYFACANDAS